MILHLPLVVALRSKFFFVILNSSPDKLGVFAEMPASLSNVVSTVENPAVGAAVYKGQT